MADKFLGIAHIAYNLKRKVSAKKKAVVRALLDETCASIPDSARYSIIKHWSQAPTLIDFRDSVFVESRPNDGGMVTNVGRLIHFRHDVLLRMPPEVARALLAHELAHVFLLSNVDELRKIVAMAEQDGHCKISFIGTWDEIGLDPESADRNFRVVENRFLIFKESFYLGLIEMRVRQINREWGFDEDALTAWER